MSDKRPPPSPAASGPAGNHTETLNSEAGATPLSSGDRDTHARPEGASLPQPGTLIGERYRVGPVLGEGGMGVVVQAQNVVTGKQVALKWVRPSTQLDVSAMQRLVREAQVAARIHHPNAIDVYDVGEHRGALFLVEELLRGEPLSEWLKRGPADPGRLIATLLPVLDALAAAHRQGVVHRDVKPSNIFLCVDDQGHALAPKLLDFGTSSIQKQKLDASLPTLTKTGSVIGTPHYMAPEQLDEARNVDLRADIYSTGVLLYQALSGALPYHADSYSTLVLRVASGEHEPLRQRQPALPDALTAVVERAMAVRREDRFASAAELKAALVPYASSTWLHDTTTPAASTHLAEASPRVTRGGMRVALVAALLLALAMIVAAVARRAPVPAPSPVVSVPVVTATPRAVSATSTSPAPVPATPASATAPTVTDPAAQPSVVEPTLPASSASATRNRAKKTHTRATSASRANAPAVEAHAPAAAHPLDLRSDDF